MRFQSLGDKAEYMTQHVRFRSAVGAGVPVALILDGTEDGFAVDLPGTVLAVKAHSFFVGVPQVAYAANAIGEVQVFGFCRTAKFVTSRTRAASTDSYSVVATLPLGQVLRILTVAGFEGFETISASQAATAYLPIAALAQTVATAAGVASTTADTGVISYLTQIVKVFLRSM